MGVGNEMLFTWSHDHDGRHALDGKNFKRISFSEPILRQGQIWSLILLYWKKVKQWIVVYDLKLAIDDRGDKKFLLTSKLCPLGAVCPLPRGYIHVFNHEKME